MSGNSGARCWPLDRGEYRLGVVNVAGRADFDLREQPHAADRRAGLFRSNCLVAERRWDAARWAIKAYAWRFDGVRRQSARRER